MNAPAPPPAGRPHGPRALWGRYRGASRKSQVAIGCGALILILLLCSGMTAFAAALAPTSSQPPTSAVSPQPTQPPATLTPTQPPARPQPAPPTATPKPTRPPATPKPTQPSPTPKPSQPPLTRQQILEKEVHDAHPGGTITKVEDDQADNMILVSVTAQDNFTKGMVRDGIKLDAFVIEQAIWTRPVTANQVYVGFYGQTVDRYGNESTSLIANVTLTRETAAKFNWKNLTSRTAWEAYDYHYMLPDLANG